MAIDPTANFVRGVVTENVDDSQTTISVEDSNVFGDVASSGFNLVLWDATSYARPDQDPDVEIVRVTQVSAGFMYIERGQEGTSASSHPQGSALHLSPTAKMFSDIESTFAVDGDSESTSFYKIDAGTFDASNYDNQDIIFERE